MSSSTTPPHDAADTLTAEWPDSEATEAWAARLARSAPVPAVVFLHGDLGAGKSTLARAWLRALGVTGAIRSPTYTLVERYPIGSGEPHHVALGPLNQVAAEALHLDLYRIGNGAELEFLGLDDVPAALWLVEWPERGEGGLPAADLHVFLSWHPDGRDGRLCRLEAGSAAGRAWLQRLAAAPA